MLLLKSSSVLDEMLLLVYTMWESGIMIFIKYDFLCVEEIDPKIKKKNPLFWHR